MRRSAPLHSSGISCVASRSTSLFRTSRLLAMAPTVEYSLYHVLGNNTARSTELIGPVNCYIMNFQAEHGFPRKFHYDGCTVPRGSSGLLCAKSVDGHGRCSHDSRIKGKVKAMFRFHVLLMDQSGCEPLFAQILDQAAELLGMSAERFKDLPHLDQVQHVHAATSNVKRYSLWIASRVDPRTEKWMPTVQQLCPWEPSVPASPLRSKPDFCSPKRELKTPKKEKSAVSPSSPEWLSPPEYLSPEHRVGSSTHSQNSRRSIGGESSSATPTQSELCSKFDRFAAFEEWLEHKKKNEVITID
jgi:hypothetical protein